MATSTQVKRVLVQLQADDGDAEAKLDAIAAKAKELGELHPELKPKIEKATALAQAKVLRDEVYGILKPPEPIVPEVDNSEAEVKLIGLRSDLDELNARADKALLIQVDDNAAKAKILDLKAKLAALSERVEPDISVAGIAKADAEIAALALKLEELGKAKIEPEVKPKADEVAAADAGVKAAAAVDKGFRLKISPMVAGWGSLIGLGLAGLPAAAAEVGALAGGLLAAKLLIGSSQVKGPLYKQWTELSQGLMSVLRTSTLPLLQPLSQAFAQIGQWARAIKPELTATFASIGPLIQPLARGLEGLVTGVLPGFVTLMRSAQPAVAALSGVLGSLSQTVGALLGGMAPAVRASAGVWTSLALLLRNLMPVVTALTHQLAGALGPALHAVAQVVAILAPPVARVTGLILQLAGSAVTTLVRALAQVLPPAARVVAVLVSGLAPILPVLERSFTQMAASVTTQLMGSIIQALPQVQHLIGDLLTLAQHVIIPLLPSIEQLAGDLILTQTAGVRPLIGPLVQLADVLVQLADKVIVPLMPQIVQLTGYLVDLANAALKAMSLVSSVLSLFGVGGGGGAVQGLGGWSASASLPQISLAGFSAGSAAGAAYGGAWGAGVLASSVKNAQNSTRPLPANLAAILASGVQANLAGTAAQVASAISQLVGAVNTDIGAKVISAGQGSALVTWLEGDGRRLELIADKRARILAEIAAGQKYAASVASTIRGQDDLQTASAGGWNGGPQTNAQIVGNLQIDVQKIRLFAQNIRKLSKMGLNRTYLAQLIQMGPDAGGQLAEQLAGGGELDIKQINSAESQIVQVSGYLGKTAANAMYDSGTQAGKGFLSGLEAQQSALEKMMERLAKSMIDTWKKELGIHSPSSVARQLAREWPNGLILGLEDGHSGVMTAASRMARAMIPQQRGMAGYGGYGASGGYLQVEWVGGQGDQQFLTWLKKNIRIRGGKPEVVGA